MFEWARGGGKLADLKGGFKEAYDRLELSPEQQVARCSDAATGSAQRGSERSIGRLIEDWRKGRKAQ